MAFPIILDHLLKVVTYCQLGNQAGINIHYFRPRTIEAPANSVTLANGLSAILGPLYRNLLCNLATYNGLTLEDITAPTPFEPQPSDSGVGVGIAGDEPLPAQVSGIITLKTGLIGRDNRGRRYIPFPAEDDSIVTSSNNPYPIGSYVAFLNLLGAKLVTTSVPVGGGNNVTLNGQILHHSDGLTTGLDSYLSRQEWATQRRRGDYGRPNILPF